MLLTVSGPPGSGKSTTAAALAEAFDLEHISGGDIFRELAAERDMTAVEFNKLAEEDDQIDRDLDRRLRTIALERDDVLLESRLAGWLAGDAADLRFWLDAPVDVRAERIADREDKAVDTARDETVTREESEKHRYGEYYDIDITDLSIYDIALNTARWGEAEVPEIITAAVESYDASDDEGKYPVEGIRYDF
ncbi:cytidylate kinase [Haloferax mediterranei ATCC 33500]|uniref:Cytidylate kinase n=1 Tax=Haloferax mediterranei (strain ATCC 33500 / DSM 1411 / JCM 8866 / NBRC 14739 / NCIMB 2177 / R-4) TaxID=523841 RepID=I3R7I0_HALMT|nr:AAA family ATPase [Haloferax mediterranei]AFK20190.2 cytidylate kinase [Haloferax mediterranei ATCC 33500]AHZ23566.1 cytidylate kinase [Haloferax mediterranei ATCC 33500]ELZ99050.1 cytidylate kinase [Haloferax mediterranei ATCC 33500]MDX5987053.1 AAA family ATPase [Haloferax mediterranei ATCC 33500]QCQ76370.1 cytidylate kinase [Haloferax mediterranei ATCC 33500]